MCGYVMNILNLYLRVCKWYTINQFCKFPTGLTWLQLLVKSNQFSAVLLNQSTHFYSRCISFKLVISVARKNRYSTGRRRRNDQSGLQSQAATVTLKYDVIINRII